MNSAVCTTVSSNADILYIGYPKAASVFLGMFLENHPEVTTDHNRLAPLFLPHSAEKLSFVAVKDQGKVHISRDESVAESLWVTDIECWRRYYHVPGAWHRVKRSVLIDPYEAAARLRNVHPNAKVLMVIREQADWLNSAYKYSINGLPSSQRSFAEYCATPYGAVLLQAGYYDLTIRAYADVFGGDRICVLRYEDLIDEPQRFAARLCTFAGISERPLPQQRENKSHAQIARLLRSFPVVGRLPRHVKDTIKPYVSRLLPGERGMLISAREIGMLRSMYAVSNVRTEKLLEALSSDARQPRRMEAAS